MTVSARFVPTVLAGALVSLLAAAPACRPAPGPSADYDEAFRGWSALQAELGFDAAVDPRADELLAKLARVSPDSYDALAATRLAERIRAERSERQAARPVPIDPPPELFAPSGGRAADAPKPAAAAAALPVVGSQAVDFRKDFGACVEVVAPLYRPDASAGEAFGLVDSDACRAAHPALAGQLVFVADDRIYNVAPKEQGRTVELVATDGGLVLAPAAAAPPPVAVAPPPAPPAAPPPQPIPQAPVMWVPGQPVPADEVELLGR